MSLASLQLSFLACKISIIKVTTAQYFSGINHLLMYINISLDYILALISLLYQKPVHVVLKFQITSNLQITH